MNITKNLVFDNNICGCLFATSQTKQACAAARPRPAAAPLRSDLREPVARPGGARAARSAQADLSENVYERVLLQIYKNDTFLWQQGINRRSELNDCLAYSMRFACHKYIRRCEVGDKNTVLHKAKSFVSCAVGRIDS